MTLTKVLNISPTQERALCKITRNIMRALRVGLNRDQISWVLRNLYGWELRQVDVHEPFGDQELEAAQRLSES